MEYARKEKVRQKRKGQKGEENDLSLNVFGCPWKKEGQEPCSLVVLLDFPYEGNQGCIPPLHHCCNYRIIKKQ